MRIPAPFSIGLTALAIATLSACSSSDDTPEPVATGEAAVLTSDGQIATLNLGAPATLVSKLTIRGLAQGETLLGLDLRPATGELYAVSSLGNLYTLDPATGQTAFKARLVGDGSTGYTGLQGERFGVDFNPVADRLRVVSNSGQNLRINVDTGVTILDGPINGAPGVAITASAYTNSFAGTSSTRLFNMDCATGKIYLQNPPNAGTQANGTDFTACDNAGGFDIDARTNMAYAALQVNGVWGLYGTQITGDAIGSPTALGTIGGGLSVQGLALIKPPAAPTVFVLTETNQLARINPQSPNNLLGRMAVNGLTPGETLVGMDIRPANGKLYALSSNARVLELDPSTGNTTLVSVLSADPTDTTAPFSTLAGERFSVDFNPVADRLRVISNTGQSLRINVDTGVTVSDGNINRTLNGTNDPASVVAAAYTHSYNPKPTGTTLFDIDAVRQVLAKQDPPNAGTLVNVGMGLGVAIPGNQNSALDIAGGDNGLVLAALRPSGTGPYQLYNINLSTGVASVRGAVSGTPDIGGANGPGIQDLAIRY